MDNMTVRKNLGKKKSRTWIDMEKVYRMIDSGMTVTQAAESLVFQKPLCTGATGNTRNRQST
jgi:hypothetical protein